LYINDIADNTQSFSRLFADDTSLLYSSNNINEIEVIVNSDLSKIYNWYKFYILIIEDNTRLIGCLVSRKNNTFCFLWVKVNEPFF
jgi:hypothetical protein